MTHTTPKKMIAYCFDRLWLFRFRDESKLVTWRCHLQDMNPVAKLLAAKVASADHFGFEASRLAGTGDSRYDRIYRGVELKARIEPRR